MSGDDLLTIGGVDYEAFKVTVGAGRGALVRFDIRESPAEARPLPARGDEGIDISRHNGNFDWKIAKESGVKFAFIRATMGAPSKTYSGKDDRFVYNRAGCRAAEILDGVYHYFVNGVQAQAQFDNLKSVIGADYGQLPIVVDVERRRDERGVPEPVDKTAFADSLRAFLNLLETAYGHKPLIYTSRMEWEAMTTLPEWESEYQYFVAQYANALTAIRPRWRVAVWQYAVLYDGLGTVDRDRWLGGAANGSARHNFAPRTNQQVINLFSKAAGANYIEWITRAGLATLFGARQAVYSGPDVEGLPLTDGERAALLGVV